MPRQARIILSNTAHHIVQRGHNRQIVFVEKQDYDYYLGTLKEWKRELNVNVYGYCLMTNHIHLILDPLDEPDNLGRLMKRLAGRQTRYVNHQENRTGSLWEGRYKSSPIETDNYLLACHRYVERNPIKAGMVVAVDEYDWSSYSQHAGLEERWIDLDEGYLSLSVDDDERFKRYKQYVAEAGTSSESQLINKALQRGKLTGSNRFIEDVEQRLGQRIENRGPGRPRRK